MTPKPRSKAALLKATPRLSAVVVTREAGSDLEYCLSSLLTDQAVDELVIVDNGERTEVASALRALSADRRDVRLVQGQGDVGLAQGLNLGAGQAGGRWLLFVRPDVVVQPGAVDRLLRAGRQARTPAAIEGALAQRVTGRSERGFIGPQPADCLNGELVLLSRADFEAVRGFRLDAQESPFADLSRRLAAAGGEVLRQPAALAVPVRVRPTLVQGLTAPLLSLFAWLGVRRRKL